MTNEILNKFAVDRNGKKLGKIIRIDQLAGKTIKKEIPYAIIYVVKSFRVSVKIPIEISKILKNDEHYIWFDILQKDFEDQVIKERAIVKQKYAMRQATNKSIVGYGYRNR